MGISAPQSVVVLRSELATADSLAPSEHKVIQQESSDAAHKSASGC